MKVCTVAERQVLWEQARTACGLTEEILVENAGGAVARVLDDLCGARGRHVAVVCGGGVEGTVGLVAARWLACRDASVSTLLVGELDALGTESMERLRRAGGVVETEPTPARIAELISSADAVVDALGPMVDDAELVELFGAAGGPVLSVDLPAGVDGDTGRVGAATVRADHTICLGLPLRGTLLFPGAARCGEVRVGALSLPPALVHSPRVEVSLVSPPPLPTRPVDGHKGTFGDTLVVAGAASYYGAPSLAALSLYRAGGGYARLAAPRSVVPVVAGIGPEIVFAPQAHTDEGTLALSALEPILALCRVVDFVVLGPGLSLHDETQELVRRLVPAIDLPLLLDGDALTAVAADLDRISARVAPTVLTPHLGEMARIAGLSVAEVRADTVGVVQSTCTRLGAHVVLKGAHSLVGTPDGRVFVNTTGNSGMATAGSGDVLTGTIAAMSGLGLDLEGAARAGVFVHGLAGDLAARAIGEDGVTATAVLDHLPAAVRAYREDHATLTRGLEWV